LQKAAMVMPGGFFVLQIALNIVMFQHGINFLDCVPLKFGRNR